MAYVSSESCATENELRNRLRAMEIENAYKDKRLAELERLLHIRRGSGRKLEKQSMRT